MLIYCIIRIYPFIKNYLSVPFIIRGKGYYCRQKHLN